ncbi:endonuclease/exonuclease/phosphatase family protein [Tsuneonella sp. YG55]|uniref:Endonuclease/exonuclease/phosphatase family protein n=1 Tax=Tsuneonella litorea TaxID=2976475 RepID=A0A9X2W2Y5_9SPHN|nr:endonuclease/exonuclease/phosphatase family protein [Tsuneonella litorea]MCT2559648.1 endonuclease/exonuclease/phosphatase family protein [Tsuneonella litorea]
MTIAVVMLISSLVSLIPSDAWFIRTLDLVREPLIFASVFLVVLSLFAESRARAVAIACLALTIGINAWRVWPYWPIAREQIALEDNRPGAGPGCFSAMSVNVKVENDDHDRIAAQIARYDPDLLLLVETDRRWIEALEPVLSTYPAVQRHPQPEAFGMVFATRLPVLKANIVENTYRDTPTLYATVQPQGANPIEFIGLHPKPPLPGWNTELRDENIVRAGIQTPDRLPDAFVMGDFNDVPWSRTTTKFRQTGAWQDPRIGRGTFPTFPADFLLLGWPLDQFMVKGRLKVAAFEVLPDNGSDHRALFARLCAAPLAAPQ